MFDIGFAELMIIGVVALLVIGPERLPEAARTASAWLNRIRRGFNDIKQEVQQELHNDAVMRDLRETGSSLKRETEAFRENLSQGLNAPEIRKSSASKTSGDPQTPGIAGAVADAGETPGPETPASSDADSRVETRSGQGSQQAPASTDDAGQHK